MDERRLHDATRALGLSESEHDTYLAVLSGGTVSVEDVAAETDRPEAEVREVASALADRELLAIDAGEESPVLRARPPAEVADALTRHVDEYEAAAEAVYSRTPEAEPPFEQLQSLRAVRRRLVRQVEAARDELLLVAPGTLLDGVREELAAAVERGVMVYLLVVAPDAEAALEDLVVGEHVHVLRSWEATDLVFSLQDVTAGVLGELGCLEGRRRSGERAVAFRQPLLAGWLYGNAVSNIWPGGVQRGLADPPSLPATFRHFRSGVTAAALHDLQGTELVVDVEGTDLSSGEPISLERTPVRHVKQSLVEPTNADFPIENALVVETDDGLVTVAQDTGGLSAFYEDFAAREVTLREA